MLSSCPSADTVSLTSKQQCVALRFFERVVANVSKSHMSIGTVSVTVTHYQYNYCLCLYMYSMCVYVSKHSVCL